jgi:hypothetical protein
MAIRLSVRHGKVLSLLLSVVVTFGCGGGFSLPLPNSPQSLSSFYPSSGASGTSVSLTGSNFTNVKAVSFNGQAAGNFLVSSPQLITVVVPDNATSGKISILTGEGTIASSTNFTVPGLPPVIQSFVPPQGPPGTTVTIAGTNFSDVNAVLFDGLATAFEVHGESQIVAIAPGVAGSGKIALSTGQYNATSAAPFTVTNSAPSQTPAPLISSFSPASGIAGTTVIVTGTGFTGATAVSFNGIVATFTVNNDSQIATTVPNGASGGAISVTTPAGSAMSTSAFQFELPPMINNINPVSGQAGSIVTISGANLAGATAVAFNGMPAMFTVISSTQIAATAPTGATTGNITATTPWGTASSPVTFAFAPPSTLDLTVDGLYITQATQTYPAAVPLIAGRSGWVRVFVKANQQNSVTPGVLVQFIAGGITRSLNIAASVPGVPLSIDPNTTNSWNAPVPGSWIVPGMTVVAEVDPSHQVSVSSTANNTASLSPDVRTVPPFQLTLVPVQFSNGQVGDMGDPNTFAQEVRSAYPVPDQMDVIESAPLYADVAINYYSSEGDWGYVLNLIYIKRLNDGTGRQYYGVLPVAFGGGILGVSDYTVGEGVDNTTAFYPPETLLHELGHNHGRMHSPCGNPGALDPAYPYPAGNIGQPGWEPYLTANNLHPLTAPDFMSYCMSDYWISDWNYEHIMDVRGYVGGTPMVARDALAQDDDTAVSGLLVSGWIANGELTLQPAFQMTAPAAPPAVGPYLWQALDVNGAVLASVNFQTNPIIDSPDPTAADFAFLVPLSQGTIDEIQSVQVTENSGPALATAAHAKAQAMASIAAQGYAAQTLPNHRLQLTWDAGSAPAIMLRDGRTGEFRGILHGGSALLNDPPVDLEIQFSDGIHSQIVHSTRNSNP